MVGNLNIKKNSTMGAKYPTKFEKSQLPDDVKLLFNKGVELWQCIQNYEVGALDATEFAKAIREIEFRYTSEKRNQNEFPTCCVN